MATPTLILYWALGGFEHRLSPLPDGGIAQGAAVIIAVLAHRVEEIREKK